LRNAAVAVFMGEGEADSTGAVDSQAGDFMAVVRFTAAWEWVGSEAAERIEVAWEADKRSEEGRTADQAACGGSLAIRTEAADLPDQGVSDRAAQRHSGAALARVAATALAGDTVPEV